MEDPYNLDRFVSAQRDVYPDVVAELRQGRKTSHWMWFVFPQIAGLGHSSMAARYAISSLDEARAYLEHPVLSGRLIECATILLANTDSTAAEIFGDVDAMKLRSSMTLFQRAEPAESVFGRVIDRYFEGVPDAATDRLIG
jgi:uncharacterized protein (DUF1810 family)